MADVLRDPRALSDSAPLGNIPLVEGADRRADAPTDQGGGRSEEPRGATPHRRDVDNAGSGCRRNPGGASRALDYDRSVEILPGDEAGLSLHRAVCDLDHRSVRRAGNDLDRSLIVDLLCGQIPADVAEHPGHATLLLKLRDLQIGRFVRI